MPDIDRFLALAKKRGASDLHFVVGSAPILRIQGQLVTTEFPPIGTRDGWRILTEILTQQQVEQFQRDLEIDLAYQAEEVSRFRVTLFYQRKGIGGVFRLIPSRIPTLEELRLPKIVRSFADMSQGLVLVTGATGSGKSTTLAAIIDIINGKLQRHVLTIEDPIEFVHQSKSCLITQREVGMETESFSSGLRMVNRQDTDIVLVGEMRDRETVSLTLSAAETGLYVLATVHTNSAVKTVDRLIDVFPPAEQEHVRYILSTTLKGVVSQMLVPSADGKGRVPAVEVMFNNSAVSNCIREGKTYQLPSVLQSGRKEGMQSMDQSMVELYRRGLITRDSALSRIQEKALLGRL